MGDGEKKSDNKMPRLGDELLGEKEAENVALPEVLPVLPVRGLVFFPHLVLPLAVSSENDAKLVNEVVMGNRLMAVVAVRDEKADQPTPDQLRSLLRREDHPPGEHRRRHDRDPRVVTKHDRSVSEAHRPLPPPAR